MPFEKYNSYQHVSDLQSCFLKWSHIQETFPLYLFAQIVEIDCRESIPFARPKSSIRTGSTVSLFARVDFLLESCLPREKSHSRRQFDQVQFIFINLESRMNDSSIFSVNSGANFFLGHSATHRVLIKLLSPETRNFSLYFPVVEHLSSFSDSYGCRS